MKRYFLTILLIVTLLTSMVSPYVYALEDTFQTRLTVVSTDNDPPSIPADLIATAVSISAIDLSWSASTDDVAVSGYRVFRDGEIIASTTSTTYSDTGLSESTSYDYNVEAFDSVPRYSGRSSTSTASTLTSPVTPEDEEVVSGGTSGSVVNPKIKDLLISSSQKYSILSFSTDQVVQARVYWGKTKDYEIGSVSGLIYSTDHVVRLDSLNSDEKYYFRIEVVNKFGKTAFLEDYFISLKEIERYVIPNVTNLKSTQEGESVKISWDNPSDFQIDSIRIVKSDKFFPRDPNDGEVVFEGLDDVYLDSRVDISKKYYYSVFVRDSLGGYSSGALVGATVYGEGDVVPEISDDPFGDISIIQNVHPDIASLTLQDFDFIQDDRKLANIGSTVAIDGSKNLTIILKYDKVPEILKTIAFTLVDPNDASNIFPFLLRVNKDKTAYEATIASLGKSGNYGLHVVVLDYKNQGLKRLNGNLKAFVFGGTSSSVQVSLMNINYLVIPILALILLLLVLLKGRRKYKEDRVFVQ